MKLIKRVIISIALIFGFTTLNAHGGGSHTHKSVELEESKIKSIATTYLSKLVKKNKIDKSWLKSSVIDSEKKIFGKQMEWVISYGNDHIEETERKILYIFVDMKGIVTGANYTGI